MSDERSVEVRRAYVAWAAVCVIWGTTYLAIKVALDSLPPFLMGGVRYLAAGGLLAGVLAARGLPLPGVSSWPAFTLLGALMLGVGNGGVVVAEQWIASGFTAVLIATTPFWMVAVESRFPGGERLTRQHLAGLAIGFAGILLLAWPDLTTNHGGGWKVMAGVIAVQVAERARRDRGRVARVLDVMVAEAHTADRMVLDHRQGVAPDDPPNRQALLCKRRRPLEAQ